MGLEYLHTEHIVHGDLKGVWELFYCQTESPRSHHSLLQTNILITPSSRACITDFGLSTITDAASLQFTHSKNSVHGGTARYQAPEVLSAEMPNHYGSDVYAFACVCYEVCPLHFLPPCSLADKVSIDIDRKASILRSA
jgi:serine/threonine protein kinase